MACRCWLFRASHPKTPFYWFEGRGDAGELQFGSTYLQRLSRASKYCIRCLKTHKCNRTAGFCWPSPNTEVDGAGSMVHRSRWRSWGVGQNEIAPLNSPVSPHPRSLQDSATADGGSVSRALLGGLVACSKSSAA